MKPSSPLTSAARWTLLGFAGLLALIALVVVVENWRGDRAWRACEQALLARGEALAFSAFATPEVPEERNFFKAPVLAAISYASPKQAPARTVLEGARLDAIARALVGNYSDLAVAQRLFVANGLLREPVTSEPAAAILGALQPAAPLLDSIRDAARERPDTWLPFKSPTQGRLLEVGTLFNVGKLLAFRAYLAIELRRPDDAFADLTALLRLAEGMRGGSKTLLQAAAGQALYAASATAVEAGCRRHLWSDPQLVHLEVLLARHESIAGLQEALRVERAWSVAYLDSLAEPRMRAVRPWWFFHGWTQQNKVRTCRFVDAALATLDPRAGRVQPDRLAELERQSAELASTRGPYVHFARMFASKLGSMIRHGGEAASSITRLRANLALERYWLAHRDYPATLDGVAAGEHPLRDALDGQPLGYARLSAENYSLSHLAADARTRTTWSLRPGR